MPILDFGRTSARVDQAKALNERSLIAWQKALETAYKEVRDALVSLDSNSTAEEAQTVRVESTQKALDLAKLRYEAGYSGYLEVLDAQRSANEAQLAAIATRQARLDCRRRSVQSPGGRLEAGSHKRNLAAGQHAGGGGQQRVNRTARQAGRRRLASNRQTPAATETLRLSTLPCMERDQLIAGFPGQAAHALAFRPQHPGRSLRPVGRVQAVAGFAGGTHQPDVTLLQFAQATGKIGDGDVGHAFGCPTGRFNRHLVQAGRPVFRRNHCMHPGGIGYPQTGRPDCVDR